MGAKILRFPTTASGEVAGAVCVEMQGDAMYFSHYITLSLDVWRVSPAFCSFNRRVSLGCDSSSSLRRLPSNRTDPSPQ